MIVTRSKILSIAGFDPTGGAGVMADVKTAEQLEVYAMAIITANTLQTEDVFFETNWLTIESIEKSIRIILSKYEISVVKIGIVPNLDYLQRIVLLVKQMNPQCKIVWDTVIKATAGTHFFALENMKELSKTLQLIDLITPNFDEYQLLKPYLGSSNAILLKGGHKLDNIGTDSLIFNNQNIEILPQTTKVFPKHGSGCVLSSAIASYLAKGNSLEESCRLGKIYTEQFLQSNDTLLGYHHGNK